MSDLVSSLTKFAYRVDLAISGCGTFFLSCDVRVKDEGKEIREQESGISGKVGERLLLIVQCMIELFPAFAQEEYNLRRHKISCKNNISVLEVKIREVKLQNLKCDLHRQQNILFLLLE